MPLCNMMNCSGLGTDFLGPCSIAMFNLVIIFFIGIFAGKWLDIFNKIYGIVGGIILSILVVTFTCSPRWGLVGGIAGLLIGGFLAGQWLGEGEEYGY